jgi:MFS transporter, DHA2 family, multidrug resistance protein
MSSAVVADTVPEEVHARRWWTLAVLCISLLIIVMDNTILNVAIPRLVEDLGASNSQLQWIIDGYTLVFAGLLLTTGSWGDRFGRKRALRIGVVVFALGSALSALATTPTNLILTRALMGVGGALIMPSTLSILTNVFRDPKERGRAIAVWAGFSGLGVAIGPLTGGFLLNHFSWSSVFWVNIPIGVLALVGGYFFIPESKDPNAPKLDLPAAFLSIVGLGALLFAIIEVPVDGWTDAKVLGAVVVAIVALGGFVVREMTTDHPMLDVSFFKNRRFSAANSSITLTFFAMFGSMFLMTQYWQFVQGYSPFEAGYRLVPYALVMMVTAPLSARFVERFGTKAVVTTGLLIVGLALLLLSFIHADTAYLKVIGGLSLMSGGMGLVMAPATESVMGSLPREKAGVGSAVNDTTRQVGGALGVAVIGSLVASVYSSRVATAADRFGVTGEQLTAAKGSLGDALAQAGQLGDRAGDWVTAAKDSFVSAFSSGLRLGAVILMVAAGVALAYLPARAHAGEAELQTRGVEGDGRVERVPAVPPVPGLATGGYDDLDGFGVLAD